MQDVSTQLLQTERNQFIDIQDQLERHCNVPPVISFIIAKYDFNLIKSYVLLLLVNEWGFEPIVIKEANHFVSFRFADVQMLDVLHFLGQAMRLASFLRACKTSETKGYFPYEGFNDPEKLNNTLLPPYDTFFSKLRNKKLLKKDSSDFQSLIDRGLPSKEALSRLKLKQSPATRQKNDQYLASVQQQENMRTFKRLSALV